MKIQKYMFEFTATVVNKDKTTQPGTFFVVAATEEDGLQRLMSDNQKITDFVYTGKNFKCNRDW